jgi:hypothetical protein
MSSNAGGGGVAGTPRNEYSCAHGAQINLRDLSSNSIFNLCSIGVVDKKEIPFFTFVDFYYLSVELTEANFFVIKQTYVTISHVGIFDPAL